MAKIINLWQASSEFNFVSPKERLTEYYSVYQDHELGRIADLIPWADWIRTFRQHGYRIKRKGPLSTFSLRGKLALMFLKSYYNGISDRRLIDLLNRDPFLQFFCEVYIPIDAPIRNYKILSAIRCELSPYLHIEALQSDLAKALKPFLNQTHIVHLDATVYESNIRYPTDVKLLWEACSWIHHQNQMICKRIKVRNIRSKYKPITQAYKSYQKTKKKTYKKTVRLKKRLLALLYKLLHFHNQLMDYMGCSPEDLPPTYGQRSKAIIGVCCQQDHLLQGHKIADRMVSLDKPFLRPIVRGKERKRVEFGAKVHMIQIDGINFIEHFSFEAFNEATRLIPAVYTARRYFGKITHLGADNIYPTNKNRKYCSQNGITTSFVRKGKAGLYEPQRKQMQAILAKDRATRLEGSFGVEKNHYGLNRIRARTSNTEKLWIFFGIHTANLVRLAKRIHNNSFAHSTG